MIITDIVHQEIRTQLASHRPERGGALYGPRGYPVVSHFEYDFDGETSAVSYVPSSRLIANVGTVERETGLQLKGIIHSHPPGLIRPSTGDQLTAGSFFRLNPHFSSIALPIVQEINSSELHNSELESPFIFWYRAERRSSAMASDRLVAFGTRRPPSVAILSEDFYVLPIWTHITLLLDLLKEKGFDLTCERKLQHLRIANAELIGGVASDSAGREFMYFVSFDYPVTSPVVLFQKSGSTDHLPISWSGLKDVTPSLAFVAEALIKEWRPGRLSKIGVNVYV